MIEHEHTFGSPFGKTDIAVEMSTVAVEVSTVAGMVAVAENA